jgi:hypothetical protein
MTTIASGPKELRVTPVRDRDAERYTARMRALLLLPAFLAACPNNLTEVCGLPNTAPDVGEGDGTALLDGEVFAESATWTPGSNASLTIGTLDMIIAVDETGTSLDDLLLDNALPICVRQGERSETSGVANFVAEGMASDATHTGGVAIVALDDNDILVGRFAVDVAGGGQERSFTEGEFRALRR